MRTRMMLSVVFLGVVLSVLAGCVPTAEMKLNLSPERETVYKVVMETGKDYAFVQPSVNKTKERRTVGRLEMVFSQKVESADQQGAVADITIKELRYLSEDSKGQVIDFDSTAEAGKSDPLFALVGQSYKIKIASNGSVEVIDVGAAREAIKEESSAKKIANRLFSDEEIAKRHQVLALIDVKKTLCKKGDTWSTVAASPAGMLKQKSFEKVYTLTDIKKRNGDDVAFVTMNAVPSLKRAATAPEKESAASFFANMFDEKDNYTGKMVLNLTTGEIDSYEEVLKAEWVAVEPPEEQKSDKGPDQLTMGFSSLYSIEKVD